MGKIIVSKCGRILANIFLQKFLIFIGFDVNKLDGFILLLQPTSHLNYIFCRMSCWLMISVTFCRTESNKNWYCSFSILEMGSLPKI